MTAVPKALNPIGTRYRLVVPLARGGMAEVHLAIDLEQAAEAPAVVIKVARRDQERWGRAEDLLDLLRAEGRLGLLLSRVPHPAIVRTLDMGEDPDLGPYLVHEYVPGFTLRQILKELTQRGDPMPVEVATGIVRAIAEGLAEVHAARDPGDGRRLEVVHRDVSPQNILLSTQGQAKLIDFGVARAEIERVTTRTGIVKGKPAYLAPEQLEGGEVDGRSDLFSLNVVYWELLTGRRLFQGRSELSLIRQITAVSRWIQDPSKYRRDVPADIDSLLRDSLSLNPDARPHDLGEYAARLARAARNLPPADPSQISRWLRRSLGDLVQAQRSEHAALIARARGGGAAPPPRLVPDVVAAVAAAEDAPDLPELTEVTPAFEFPPSTAVPLPLPPDARPGWVSDDGPRALEQAERILAPPPEPPAMELPPTQDEEEREKTELTTTRSANASEADQLPSSPPLRPVKLEVASAPIGRAGKAIGNLSSSRNGNVELLRASARRESSRGRSGSVQGWVASGLGIALIGFSLTVGRDIYLSSTHPRAIAPTSLPGGVPGEYAIRSLRVRPAHPQARLRIGSAIVSLDGDGRAAVPAGQPGELLLEIPGYQSLRLPALASAGAGADGIVLEPAPVSWGQLSLQVWPSADVVIRLAGGGTWAGASPFRSLRLPTGAHRLHLRNPVLVIEREIPLDIAEGQELNLNLDLRPTR